MNFVKSITDVVNELRAMRYGKRALKAATEGDFANAELMYKNALAVMEKTFGNVNGTIVYVVNLANLYAMTGEDDKARKYYLDMIERASGASNASLEGLDEFAKHYSDWLERKNIEKDRDEIYLRYKKIREMMLQNQQSG